MSRALTRLSAASMFVVLLGLGAAPGASATAATTNPFACTPQAGVDHYTVLNVRGSREGGTAAHAAAFRPVNRPDYAERVQLATSRAVDVAAVEQRLAARSSAAGRRALFVHLELSYPAWMGTTSPSNLPSAQAAAARRWLSAA